jgi:large subunit ribosomal protein L23
MSPTNKSLTIHPRVSEKAYAMSQTGTYVFVVPVTTNKVEVAKAVAAQFNVTVLTVNTATQKGKPVRFYRGGKFDSGSRSDLKKAYVRLQDGDSIPVFAANDESESTAPAKTKKGGKE